MQLFMGKKLQRKRWNSRPETQDLQNTRSVEPWSSRTASCQSKKSGNEKRLNLSACRLTFIENRRGKV